MKKITESEFNLMGWDDKWHHITSLQPHGGQVGECPYCGNPWAKRGMVDMGTNVGVKPCDHIGHRNQPNRTVSKMETVAGHVEVLPDFEDALESAFWDFDARHKAKDGPSERDAFKQVLRGLFSAGIDPESRGIRAELLARRMEVESQSKIIEALRTQPQAPVVEVPSVDHPPLLSYMVLMENVNGEARALGIEGRFKKWCFRPVNGEWVTYQQLNQEQFDALLQSRKAPVVDVPSVDWIEKGLIEMGHVGPAVRLTAEHVHAILQSNPRSVMRVKANPSWFMWTFVAGVVFGWLVAWISWIEPLIKGVK